MSPVELQAILPSRHLTRIVSKDHLVGRGVATLNRVLTESE